MNVWRAQPWRAGLVSPAFERGPEVAGRDEVERVGLVDRRLELAWAEPRGEVDEGERRIRQGNAEVTGQLEAGAAVDDQPRPAAVEPHRHRDLDAPAPLGAQAPQGAGALVAQPGLRSAAESGCHPDAVLGQLGPPDGVDAAVDAMKAALADAVPDGLRPEAQREELLAGDYAMLGRGQPPDGSLRVRGGHDPT